MSWLAALRAWWWPCDGQAHCMHFAGEVDEVCGSCRQPQRFDVFKCCRCGLVRSEKRRY